MFKRIFSLLLIAFLSISSFSQTSLNDYKYVIVPNKFDFLSEPDQYRLNYLSKLLFEKHGFISVMEDDILPSDLSRNNCLALKSDVIKEPGAFKSKLKIQLKNCKNEIVFTSQTGESREKKYQVAYTLALRQAFNSFDAINHEYKPVAAPVSMVNENNIKESKKEAEKLKAEIETLKKEKETVAGNNSKPKTTDSIVLKSIENPVKTTVLTKAKAANNILYAQKIENGFQLVDSAPTVIYKILKTGVSKVYLVEGKQAIIYSLDANWILEYYENGTLKTKLLNIKF